MSINLYFSIPFDVLLDNPVLNFDLYINSSTRESKDMFLKLANKGERIAPIQINNFKEKFKQFYVSEEQREDYLFAILKDANKPKEEKAKIIKDKAIEHLDNLYGHPENFSSELLQETMDGSVAVVSNMINLLKDENVMSLSNLIGDLSFHDFYTYDHSINVSMYSIQLYKELNPNCSEEELLTIGMGGLFHDLGKVKLPTSIINKPGKLTDEEYDSIKTHPRIGIDLLLDGHVELQSGVEIFDIARVIHEHHESVDGSGYPRGISGDEISYFAKVCAVADFFDAITTKRSYSDSMILNDALGVMRKTVNKKIDASIFSVLEKYVQKETMQVHTEVEMGEGFDPTIPHQKLPVKRSKVQRPNIEGDFGSVKKAS